jgi:hypothetical protein
MTTIHIHDLPVYTKIKGGIDRAKSAKDSKLSDAEIEELLGWARERIPADCSFTVARNPYYYFDPATGRTNDPIYIRRKPGKFHNASETPTGAI